MGLYKLCDHKGRARDRCEHAWWGSFRGVRVSLARWTNREIDTKGSADAALDDLKRAIRNGTFDERGLGPPRDVTVLTFPEFAEIYKQRHVQAKRDREDDRLPAQTDDRSLRRLDAAGHQDGRHRGLHRRPEAAPGS